MDDLFGKISLDEEPKEKKIAYHTWSLDEENKLLNAVSTFGKDWNKIHHSLLPHLLPIEIKNKYYTLVKRSSVTESESSRTSEVEYGPKEVEKPQIVVPKIEKVTEIQKEEKIIPNIGEKVEEDAWLGFNFDEEPDFFNFDDFMK